VGSHRGRRLPILLASSKKPTDHSFREFKYRWTVKPKPGQNILPSNCPRCSGGTRWRAAKTPEIYAAIVPGPDVSPQQLVEWAVDFRRWLEHRATRVVPDPKILVRFWV
jgi:hypothetical protein